MIDFLSSDGKIQTFERQKRTVNDIIYGDGPSEIMEIARGKGKFLYRWIHLPANNWDWVQTLDQHYYFALSNKDREDRDSDQVVFRYQTSYPPADIPVEDYQICMVDRLWLWIINDKTIITCFPPPINDEMECDNTYELLEEIRKQIDNEDIGKHMTSVFHMATVITNVCAGFMDVRKAKLKHGEESMLDMFANSIGQVRSKETASFKMFEEFVKEHEKRRSKRNGRKEREDLKLGEEIDALKDIKDIQDEVNIIKYILDDQKYVLEEMKRQFTKKKPTKEEEIAEREFVEQLYDISGHQTRLDQVEKLESDSVRVQKALSGLLDLKQKQANLIEAEEARHDAEEAGRQTKTILVFTIVTIIFLPMSLLTSLFALNVNIFPHKDPDEEPAYRAQWIFGMIFGISTAIAIPAIWAAIKINELVEFFSGIKRELNYDPGPGNRTAPQKSPGTPGDQEKNPPNTASHNSGRTTSLTGAPVAPVKARLRLRNCRLRLVELIGRQGSSTTTSPDGSQLERQESSPERRK
ncbi:hypothetical protein BDY21DRAFT_379872 [Lineolata rhizophorae]|uniref:Cora-like Mg2+ transporter protein-domain-containing protein n=1 Tax=Lineolata rhizophorae TaxID=578093 RepID=A0A6A6P0F4_9PEZI|nr:hypothetical protein BDY21DRAFT_379872 [Lineolata rhizophorae]